jgi:hypothetical protein
MSFLHIYKDIDFVQLNVDLLAFFIIYLVPIVLF